MRPDYTGVWVSLGMLLASSGAAYALTGSEPLAVLFGVFSLPVSSLIDQCRQQEKRIAALERRMLEAEEGKASSSWVARIDESREQDRHYLDRQIDDLRARRFERNS